MSIKALQIMLVIAAVLCAVGVAATFGGGERAMPADFNPPDWLRSLQGLAGGPRLAARELTRNSRSFPAELRLGAHKTTVFSVTPAEDAELRRAEFTVRGNVHMRYRPVSGQQLRGKPVEEQSWSADTSRATEPAFIVYDRGGTLTLRNLRGSTARIGLKE
ncbi:hypothetical protein [Nitrococcus mobilis]|uniref:Uncharacterized protein n=1 Tax=Nitrococcus mobilis Nb-231 TaxID=314278 RepID=A4BRD3_9GAMM|nr:hypothetical protein [Nitrococcus mobilis]EAR21755.1 hypothetical protein NB231_03460 [Nitrococcus mobilis Nb-231]